MRRAIGQERRGDEISLGDGCLAHLTRAVCTNAQTFEDAIDVIESGFDSDDGFVVELRHWDNDTAALLGPIAPTPSQWPRRRTSPPREARQEPLSGKR